MLIHGRKKVCAAAQRTGFAKAKRFSWLRHYGTTRQKKRKESGNTYSLKIQAPELSHIPPVICKIHRYSDS